MDKDTQLPAEVLADIELKAEHEAALQFHPVYSPDQNTACRICYRNGAKEYATKLLQVEQERDQAKRDFDRVQKSAIQYANRKDEIEKQRTALQAKFDRYEAALKNIGDFQRTNEYWDHMTVVCIKQIANEALSGEGEKEADNG